MKSIIHIINTVKITHVYSLCWTGGGGGNTAFSAFHSYSRCMYCAFVYNMYIDLSLEGTSWGAFSKALHIPTVKRVNIHRSYVYI